ncbi:RNaseH domain-containing protein [Pseudomonas viridiflava]|uniref:RNaseH domain-containing protein n=1 Tax=Pseudomonas viridiflava TaxID=33069 RepID=UPI0013D7B0F1|nr:RNaseH domain-containing protein [Pseudomonas viridiflava]
MTLQLRTNLFQFDPEELMPVYQFAATDEYCHGWKQLTKLFDKPNLPTAGLEEILSAVSGGPVWVNYRPDPKGHAPAIASANALSYDQLCNAISFWAQETAEGGEELAHYLRPGDAKPLHASTLFADPKQSESMYKVVPWMLSSRMTEQPMESSKPLALSLCSDATLLAWDHPLTYANEGRRAIAMHAITTQLVLVHRRELPYAAVGVHLSHILPQWRHATNKVWFNTGRGISKFAIHIPPMTDGKFTTQYTTVAHKVLKQLGSLELPKLGDGDLEMAGNLRPIHAHLPPFWPVGNGAGPLFLDQASFHFQRSVTSAKPMLARRVGKMIAVRKQTDDIPVAPIKVAVITAHTDIMARIAEVGEHLDDLTPVFLEGRKPVLTLQQVQRPGALQALTTQTSYAHVKQWFESEVLPVVQPMGAAVAIVETVPAVASKTDTDPKHILRALFAKHGIATQFLMHIPPTPASGTADSTGPAPGAMDRKMGKRIQKLVAKRQAASDDIEPSVDYPAINGLLDAIRSTGYTPQPLLQVKGIPDNTMVISIYLEQIRRQGADEFLPVITRVKVGTRDMEVFCPAPVSSERQPGDKAAPASDKWVSYQQGLCRIHATPTLMGKDEAVKLINRAMLAPTPVADAPLIVLMNAGLKRLYPGLNDGAGLGVPPLPKGAWALRVRSDNQTAQMTGVHSKSPTAPAYIGSKIGVHQAEHQPSVYYFTSYTKHYSRMLSQRQKTRYDVVQARLRDSWQQLGVTEFVMIQSGDFAHSDQMALQVGLWCKFAPLWDGFLRLPSPLHAARQIAADHPIIERHRKSSF